MRKRIHFLSVAVLLHMALANLHGQPNAPKTAAIPAWKLTDKWNLEITSFPRPATNAPGKGDPGKTSPTRFHMRALINGSETIDDHNCWKVFYVAGFDAPNHLKGKIWIVSVDKATGWTRRIIRRPENDVIEILKFEDVLFPVNLPVLLPLEFIPFIAESRTIKAKDGARRIILEKSAGENKMTYTASIMNGDTEELRIRQTWNAGEPWWSESERYVNGQKDLFVKRVPIELMKQEEADYWKLHPKAKSPPQPAGPDPFYLRRDTRLRGTLRIVAMNPKRADIIKQIQEVTGLSMTVATNIAREDPLYGDVQFSNVTAWAAMEFVMNRGLIDGKWVKEGDTGYRLEGEPTDPVAQSRAKAGLPPLPDESGPAPAESGPKSRGWLTILIASGIGIVVGAAGVLFWRQRATRLRATAVPKAG